jgi:hypothetical protein
VWVESTGPAVRPLSAELVKYTGLVVRSRASNDVVYASNDKNNDSSSRIPALDDTIDIFIENSWYTSNSRLVTWRCLTWEKNSSRCCYGVRLPFPVITALTPYRHNVFSLLRCVEQRQSLDIEGGQVSNIGKIEMKGESNTNATHISQIAILNDRRLDPGSLDRLRKGQLSASDIRLSVHNNGLVQIDHNLSYANTYQGHGQKNFYPMRQPQIKKWFTGVPESLGWLVLCIFLAILLGKKSHDEQSALFAGLAFLLVIIAICGMYFILLYKNDFFSSDNASASLGSACASAPTYCRTEDVRVATIVIPKFEFSNIEWQIFAADLVISSDHATLDERPEALNRVCVNCADHMLADDVVNRVVRESVLQPLVAGIGIGAEQANAVRYGLSHERLKCQAASVLDNAGDDVALAPDCADNWRLAGISASTRSAFLVPMSVFVAAADIGFVNLNDANKLTELWVLKARTNAVRHVKGGAIGANAHDALDLQGTDAFLCGQHHVNDAEPSAQPDIRVLEDRSDQDRKPITASLGAARALPMKWAIGPRAEASVRGLLT